MNAPLLPLETAAAIIDPLASQRVAGAGMVTAVFADGRNRLARLHQQGAAKIRLPAAPAGPLEAVLINTAGGMTGGDRLSWRIEAGTGASVVATTQACEKAYKATRGHAEVHASLVAQAGASLAWLPQETILFDRSALKRRIDAELAPDARALIVEAAVFGRLAMGETVRTATFHDRWRIRAGGRLVHAEDFAIGPTTSETLQHRTVACGASAFATVLCLGTDVDRQLDAARAIIGESGGASAWRIAETGKLLARLVARDGYALRRVLVPLVRLLNGEAALPKVWSL